jgi:hypothetical protein
MDLLGDEERREKIGELVASDRRALVSLTRDMSVVGNN